MGLNAILEPQHIVAQRAFAVRVLGLVQNLGRQLIKTMKKGAATNTTFTDPLCLSVDFISLGGHNEIIFMQATNLVRPPLKLQIASIPKNLVCRLPVK
jgi:hypothetical protein